MRRAAFLTMDSLDGFVAYGNARLFCSGMGVNDADNVRSAQRCKGQWGTAEFEDVKAEPMLIFRVKDLVNGVVARLNAILNLC